MNLEQLRKQAKELVRAARAGDADALARLDGREPILARAQLVVAREHGYASWPALVTAVEASAETFVLAATNGQRTRAEALLAARTEIADDPWARLVLGRGWEGDARTPGSAVPAQFCSWCRLRVHGGVRRLLPPTVTAVSILAAGIEQSCVSR